MENSRWVWVTSSGGMPYTAAATVRCTSDPDVSASIRPGVLREVGDAAQLHLVVVGHQEGAALAPARRPAGTACRARCAPGCCAGWAGPRRSARCGPPSGRRRRGCARPAAPRPAGSRRRSSAASPPRGSESSASMIGWAPRRLSSVWASVEKPGLGLLARGEAELVVEHRAQLRRRVDVELVAGQLLHLLLERGRRRLERVGDRLQLGPVDADAGHLHLGQHPHQRRLDVVVQHDHVLGPEAPAEAQPPCRPRRPPRRPPPGPRPAPSRPARRCRGCSWPGLLAQLRQLVLARRGVEQVGRHRRCPSRGR